MTACEWLDVFVDQKKQIKNGVRKNGYWLLDVAEAGEYDIELRRWPKETDGRISDKLPDGSGTALPIKIANLYFSGHNHRTISEKRAYGFEGLFKKVTNEDTGIVFTMNLNKGPTALHTWFRGEDEFSIGAYYVYITKK